MNFSRSRNKPFENKNDIHSAHIAVSMAYAEAEKVINACKDDKGSLDEAKAKNAFMNLTFNYFVSIETMGRHKAEQFNKKLDRYNNIFAEELKKQKANVSE